MPRNLTDNKPDDLLPDSPDAFTVDGVINRSLNYVYDPVANSLRATTSADIRPAGTGAFLLQTSGTITTVSQALPSIPAGAGYARLRFTVSISARFDGSPATGGVSDETYAAGGLLELVSASEINSFRYVGATTGTFSIVYRSS